MGYKVIRIIKEEDVLADNLQWEDAVSVVNTRAASQRLRNYSYEVRTEDDSVVYQKVAHWDGSYL